VSIADGGTVAVSGGRLAALLNGFAADAAVTIARKTEESFASLSSGRSRYKLPLVPIDQSRNSPKADNRPTTLCADFVAEVGDFGCGPIDRPPRPHERRASLKMSYNRSQEARSRPHSER
jgi:hypothetical protein